MFTSFTATGLIPDAKYCLAAFATALPFLTNIAVKLRGIGFPLWSTKSPAYSQALSIASSLNSSSFAFVNVPPPL